MPDETSPCLIATLMSCDEHSRRSFLLREGADNLLDVAEPESSNARRIRSQRESTQSIEKLCPLRSMIFFEPNHLAKDATKGFIFGRGPTADITIASDADRGISREHYAIQIIAKRSSDSSHISGHELVLTNLSKKRNEIRRSDNIPAILEQGQTTVLSSQNRILAGVTELELYDTKEPFRPDDLEQFQIALKHYRRRLKGMATIVYTFVLDSYGAYGRPAHCVP